MCVVSFVGDQFHKRWDEPIKPYVDPYTFPDYSQWTFVNPGVTKEEFESFKKEIMKELDIFKELLQGAKEYDKRNNEPNCEMEDKVAFIKKVAEWVGVDLKGVFDE